MIVASGTTDPSGDRATERPSDTSDRVSVECPSERRSDGASSRRIESSIEIADRDRELNCGRELN